MSDSDLDEFILLKDKTIQQIKDVPVLQLYKTINIVLNFNKSKRELITWVGSDAQDDLKNYVKDSGNLNNLLNSFYGETIELKKNELILHGNESKSFFKFIGIPQTKFSNRINWWVDFQNEQLEKIKKADNKAAQAERDKKYLLAIRAAEIAIKYASSIERSEIITREEEFIARMRELLRVQEEEKKTQKEIEQEINELNKAISSRNAELISEHKAKILQLYSDQLKVEPNQIHRALLLKAEEIIDEIQKEEEMRKKEEEEARRKAEEEKRKKEEEEARKRAEEEKRKKEEEEARKRAEEEKRKKEEEARRKAEEEKRKKEEEEARRKAEEEKRRKEDIHKLVEEGLDILEKGEIIDSLKKFVGVKNKIAEKIKE